MTTFVVGGTATASHPAESANLHVAVTATGDDRAGVARQVSEAHAGLLADLDALGDSAPSHTSTGLVSDTIREYRQGRDEPVVQARARVSLDLVVTDFVQLGALGGRLAETELVEIDGLTWQLHPATRRALARSARFEAVQDATDRAADYAAALDVGAPLLDRLYEEGLRPGGGGGSGAFAREAMMMKSAAHDGASFDLTPPDIEVTVTISADFTA
ncbi:hypothetical protein AX769_05350 [Frondihabitans sp. PAMC 28766]|uniref:SIMPL domain-containing protein n=1 Tax=Frondihabitans sp. PAMC 28766 TaxID=1795630 RepID=UPI00078E56ED|nr:SIMPL domain-containing protein [Frondihabitans sp. PAMC 28766]AMM19672.1 hypothetical protein AX769_05350 [Frondihabitans sp. PAMC 28766]